MATEFSSMLAALRKRQNLSQKQAARDLDISQALLSHYEKGIRECGLNFLCRAADYYGVTTDYLLGRSREHAPPRPEISLQSGTSLTDKMPAENPQQGDGQTALLCSHYNKLCNDSLTIIFSLLEKMNCDTLTREASCYIFVAIHEIYLMLSRAGSRGKDTHWLQKQEVNLRLSLCERRCRDILTGNAPPSVCTLNKDDLPSLTKEMLQAEFKNAANSLFELMDIALQPLTCVWQDSK